MFTHKPVQIPELETKTVDRKRFYLTPEGKMYPSITTVFANERWKDSKNGKRELVMMLQITLQELLQQRGTKVHHMCEDFMNNKEVKREPFLVAALFGQLKRSSKKKSITSMHKSVDYIQTSTWSLVE